MFTFIAASRVLTCATIPMQSAPMTVITAFMFPPENFRVNLVFTMDFTAIWRKCNTSKKKNFPEEAIRAEIGACRLYAIPIMISGNVLYITIL